MAEEESPGGGGTPPESHPNGGGRRKERRKAAKKEKRKQKRKEMAEKEREEADARMNDPEERWRMEMEEERERERVERETAEFEERERMFLLAVAEKERKEAAEAEEREREREEELKRNQAPHEDENESDWEYVEDGPPEIIWQGNEIIVKKKKIKVKRKDADQLLKIENPTRPTSNPLPPESESFLDSKTGSVSAQQVLDNAAQQIPNFGTEQDKAHCPFQIKTGACRFGLRCSRLHFYPDKSCTLLIKNMYNGPSLAFEQDEGLEYTDEEIERCFEEFYEDVHTEFLKFGEIVNFKGIDLNFNLFKILEIFCFLLFEYYCRRDIVDDHIFKVCRNSSLHLRGNLYVHYKSLDSAMLAYQSVNGRYFAGKQVTCEFVGVTKWRVAICGEFMRSRLKTCSRGTACNFIHCFRNPGGDYEWADWDKPPPRYWVQEMAALFGHSQQFEYDSQRNTGEIKSSEITTDTDRPPSRRSQSRERSSRDQSHDEYDSRRSSYHKRHPSRTRKVIEYTKSRNGVHDSDSDRDQSKKERGEDGHSNDTRISNRVLHNHDYHESSARRSDSDYWSNIDRDRERERDRKRYRDPRRDKNKDEDKHYEDKRKSSASKRKSKDKWDSADEDLRYKQKGKSSTAKRKSRDRSDSPEDSEFMVEDKGKSRKCLRHSNEERDLLGDIKRRGRWDDKVHVENYETSRGESWDSDRNGSRDQSR